LDRLGGKLDAPEVSAKSLGAWQERQDWRTPGRSAVLCVAHNARQRPGKRRISAALVAEKVRSDTRLLFTCLRAAVPVTLPASQMNLPEWLPDALMSIQS
jgi:hypothetical protein